MLDHVERFEERFPEFCGHWGMYPLLVMSKPARRASASMSSRASGS
jgi:hypothetical protein